MGGGPVARQYHSQTMRYVCRFTLQNMCIARNPLYVCCTEPVAAALAYGLGRTADEALILVFDLGGGTFDCSLVEAFEGCLEARRRPCNA